MLGGFSHPALGRGIPTQGALALTHSHHADRALAGEKQHRLLAGSEAGHALDAHLDIAHRSTWLHDDDVLASRAGALPGFLDLDFDARVNVAAGSIPIAFGRYDLRYDNAVGPGGQLSKVQSLDQ